MTAVDANASTEQSRELAFATLGYPVRITAVNGGAQPVKGVAVQVAGHNTVKTGSDGTVLVYDVAPGNQNVVVGSGKAQVIVVKAIIGAAAEKPQSFTLKTTSSATAVILTIVLLLLLIATGILLAIHMHHLQAVQAAPAPAKKKS